MNDFVDLIISELQSSLVLAVAAVVLCVLALGVSFFVFKKKYKDERRFPWLKAILILLFVGYITVVLYATIIRTSSYGYGNVNLHLFRAWREAWNNYSLKNWLNIILNIALFVPLGILLPFLCKIFRKWYITFGTGLGFSLMIEAVQYFSCRGLFDVDDLFVNVLGSMFGFCIIMLLLSALEKEKKRLKQCVIYAILPFITVASFAWITIAYHTQEYGNLKNTAAFTVDTKDTVFELKCNLDDAPATAPTYRTVTFTKETCDAFGAAFFEMIGATYDDVAYYDNETYFMCHSSPAHFLSVYYFDRSYEYSYVDYEDNVWTETDELTLRDKLMTYDIEIPEDAIFTYEGDGWHKFSVTRAVNGAEMIDGTIRCRYTEKGTLREIDNKMVSYEFYKEEEIISAAEAYEQLCKGHISDGDYFEYCAPDKISVLSCALEYQIDTKGFYQPVYVFELLSDNGEYAIRSIIPALR